MCDCDCDCDDCLNIFTKIVAPIIVGVLLAIGIPLWVVAGKTKTKEMWQTILSLPLFANDETFPINEYYIKKKGESSFLIDINIPAKYGDIDKKDIYIVHNMWGFDIKASLLIDEVMITNVQKKQNLNSSSSYTPLKRYPVQHIPEIGSSLRKNRIYQNTFKVFCPFDTEITEINNMQSLCESESSPMRFDGNYSSSILFPFLEKKSFSELTLRFEQSYFVPYSYNDPPEAYILFCGGKFKKEMYYAGMSLTIIGIILFVIFAILDIILLCLYII